MKRDKLRIGVITAALAMMIAGGVLTWQQDARNGKADQAKQGETAQLTEDESTGTTEQQTEETAGDADGTRAVQDQADDVENSLEQAPEMEAACEEEAVGNPEADAETAQNTPEESDGNTERQDAQAVNGTAADQNGETGSGETAANEETSAQAARSAALQRLRQIGVTVKALTHQWDEQAALLHPAAVGADAGKALAVLHQRAAGGRTQLLCRTGHHVRCTPLAFRDSSTILSQRSA